MAVDNSGTIPTISPSPYLKTVPVHCEPSEHFNPAKCLGPQRTDLHLSTGASVVKVGGLNFLWLCLRHT